MCGGLESLITICNRIAGLTFLAVDRGGVPATCPCLVDHASRVWSTGLLSWLIRSAIVLSRPCAACW